MDNVGYAVGEALRHFRRNTGTFAGAVITIFLSLFVMGTLVLGSAALSNVTRDVESKVTIQAFLSDDAVKDNGKAVDAMRSKIEGWDNVASVRYKTKEEALKEYEESSVMHGGDDLEKTNPVPASFVITMDDPERVEATAQQLVADPDFAGLADDPDDPSNSVSYGRETIEHLFRVSAAMRGVTMVLIVLFAFVSSVFVNNTIRLSVTARRREISIERLVGASNGFIRAPFMAEALIESLIGSAVSVAALQILQVTVVPHVRSALGFLALDVPASTVALTYAFLIAMGIVMGVISSQVAMKKYLHV